MFLRGNHYTTLLTEMDHRGRPVFIGRNRDCAQHQLSFTASIPPASSLYISVKDGDQEFCAVHVDTRSWKTFSNRAILRAVILYLRGSDASYGKPSMITDPEPEQAVTDSTKPPLDPAVRAYLASIGRRGGRATNRLALSVAATRNAASTWRLRRARYGPTGRRQPWQIRAAKLQAGQK